MFRKNFCGVRLVRLLQFKGHLQKVDVVYRGNYINTNCTCAALNPHDLKVYQHPPMGGV